MRHSIRPFIIVLFSLKLGLPAGAEVVDWLYQVEVPVASQSAADRQHAARRALQEMLTRVTGLRDVPMTETVLEALRRPDRFYTGYRFETSDDDEMLLEVRFEPEAIQALAGYVQSGELQHRETVLQGFDQLPQALMNLFTGGNIGKQLVKISD